MKGNCKKLFVSGKIAAKSTEQRCAEQYGEILDNARLIESNLATVGMRH